MLCHTPVFSRRLFRACAISAFLVLATPIALLAAPPSSADGLEPAAVEARAGEAVQVALLQPDSGLIGRALEAMNGERWSALLGILNSKDFKSEAEDWAHLPYARGLAYAHTGRLAGSVKYLLQARPIYHAPGADPLSCEQLYHDDLFGPVPPRFDLSLLNATEASSCEAVGNYIDAIIGRSLVVLATREPRWKPWVGKALDLLEILLEEDPRSPYADLMVYEFLAAREALRLEGDRRSSRIDRFLRLSDRIAVGYEESPLPYYLHQTRAQEYAWQGRYREALRKILDGSEGLRGESAKRAIRFAILMARSEILSEPQCDLSPGGFRVLVSPLLERVADPADREALGREIEHALDPIHYPQIIGPEGGRIRMPALEARGSAEL